MTVADRVVDLFAGPRGWSEGLRLLGARDVGIEWDAAACRTAVAAGHLTIRADVAKYPPERFAGWEGLIGSPPCPTFSAAGNGAGTRVLDLLDRAIRDEFAGRRTLARRTREMAHILRQEPRLTKWPRADRSGWAWHQARMSALVVQPARWALAIGPRWIALEQVPAVLPLWRTYAELLRGLGFSTWAGVLNCADFGVPQTRKRAFLMASRDVVVAPPQPTHAEKPIPSLFGEPERWVSMADALGWGMTDVPMPTVTAGGVKTGGAEPIARGGRALLESKRGGVVVALRRKRGAGMTERHGDRPDVGVDRPAPTLTAHPDRVAWVVDRRTNSKAAGGGMVPTVPVPMDRPSPTLTGKAGTQWIFSRPATTIVASFRPDIVASFRPDIVAAPGYRVSTSRQDAEGSVKITVQEAAVLQSFRRDYPWQGSTSKQFEQVGNAVPPRIAAHVVAVLLGVPFNPGGEAR